MRVSGTEKRLCLYSWSNRSPPGQNSMMRMRLDGVTKPAHLLVTNGCAILSRICVSCIMCSTWPIETMSAFCICLSAKTSPVLLTRHRRTVPNAPSPSVPLVTVKSLSVIGRCALMYLCSLGISTPALAPPVLSASASLACCCNSAPLAVYLRIASSSPSGPRSRWKAPRSIRTTVVPAAAAVTDAIVGAPVLSDNSPK